MNETNSVDLFRFTNHYEDVYLMGDAYLYVCAEPFGWPYLFESVVWERDEHGRLIAGKVFGSPVDELEKLHPASEEVSAEVIAEEYVRCLYDPDFYMSEEEQREEGMAEAMWHLIGDPVLAKYAS